MTIPCTAVLITNTYNQQCKNAIKSLRNFGEILIFDNNSGIQLSDVSIPQAKIMVLPSVPITDFAEARNRALSKATHDWVFFLDSDEVLQPFSAAALTHLLNTTTARGILCTRSDFFHGKQLRYGEAGKQKITRLVHASHTKFEGAVHEMPKIAGTMQTSNLAIHHFSHATIAEFIDDVTRYATLLGSQKKFSLFELLLYPPTKFFVQFILKAGFLDGYRGLVYALVMSLHSIIVRTTAYEQKNH